jgi:hypothetical protein
VVHGYIEGIARSCGLCKLAVTGDADPKSIMILDWWLSPELQVSTDSTFDRRKAALTASSAAPPPCFLNGAWIAYSSGRQRKESEYT